MPRHKHRVAKVQLRMQLLQVIGTTAAAALQSLSTTPAMGWNSCVSTPTPSCTPLHSQLLANNLQIGRPMSSRQGRALRLHVRRAARRVHIYIARRVAGNAYREKLDAQVVRDTADALVSSGLASKGYRFVNMDVSFINPVARL